MKTFLLLFGILATMPLCIMADRVSEERASQIAQKILGNNTGSACKVRRFELPVTAEQAPEKEPPYYILIATRALPLSLPKTACHP